MTKQWDEHKAEILRLYRRKSLAGVQKIMREKHGFEASLRAYRIRLNRWEQVKYRTKRRVSPIDLVATQRDPPPRIVGSPSSLAPPVEAPAHPEAVLDACTENVASGDLASRFASLIPNAPGIVDHASAPLFQDVGRDTVQRVVEKGPSNDDQGRLLEQLPVRLIVSPPTSPTELRGSPWARDPEPRHVNPRPAPDQGAFEGEVLDIKSLAFPEIPLPIESEPLRSILHKLNERTWAMINAAKDGEVTVVPRVNALSSLSNMRQHLEELADEGKLSRDQQVEISMAFVVRAWQLVKICGDMLDRKLVERGRHEAVRKRLIEEIFGRAEMRLQEEAEFLVEDLVVIKSSLENWQVKSPSVSWKPQEHARAESTPQSWLEQAHKRGDDENTTKIRFLKELDLADHDGTPSLHLAVTRGDTLAVDRLLNTGDKSLNQLNQRNSHFRTLLDIAVKTRHFALVKCLLDAGADPVLDPALEKLVFPDGVTSVSENGFGAITTLLRVARARSASVPDPQPDLQPASRVTPDTRSAPEGFRRAFVPDTQLDLPLAFVTSEHGLVDSTLGIQGFWALIPDPQPEPQPEQQPGPRTGPQRAAWMPPAFSDSGYGSTGRSAAPKGSKNEANLDSVREETASPAEEACIGTVAAIEIDDAATSYSEAGSLASEKRIDAYVSELADDLLARLKADSNDDMIDHKAVEQALRAIPRLLKAFALALGHNAPSQTHRDIMYFVHKHCSSIVAAVRSNHFSPQAKAVPNETLPPIEDVVEMWLDREHDPATLDSLPVDVADEIVRFDLLETDDAIVDGSIDESIDDEEDENDENDGNETDPVSVPGLPEYRSLIFNADEYAQLISALKREMVLAIPESELDAMTNIEERIRTGLAPQKQGKKVSRSRAPDYFDVELEINWNPRAFLETQQYGKAVHKAIASAVTLTGSAGDAQALPVSEYLRQTWPVHGPGVLSMVQAVLQDPTAGGLKRGILNDGTNLTMWQSPLDGKMHVCVKGLQDSVVQVAQIMAWMGAALRPETDEWGRSCVLVRMPVVKATDCHSEQRHRDQQQQEATPPVLRAKITFKIYSATVPASKIPANGQCWHGLFRNPVVATGFPIPRRRDSSLGLEMPLHMMAALVGTNKIEMFDSRLFIKGFSALLVPTKRCGDLMVWHLVYDGAGERISYLDGLLIGEEAGPIGSNMHEVERVRHVVGWCSEAKYSVGGPPSEVDYAAIRRSRLHLSQGSAGCVLERAEISGGGNLIQGAVSFALGTKDQPVHVSRGGYIAKLRWISKRYVLLWDEEVKKGWLVDGASALLHLLRTSLEHNRNDDFSSAFLFRWQEFAEAADGQHGRDSAVRLLIDEANRQIPIYPEKIERYEKETLEVDAASGTDDSQSTTESSSGAATNSGPKTGTREKRQSATTKTRYYRVEDRVEQLYSVLEKLIDYQTDAERRNGVVVSPSKLVPAALRPRRHLEGWDFLDVAADGGPFYPRVTTLPTVGKGWVDFTRAIHTVTLFGRGFGELIRPAGPQALSCSRWSTMPDNGYYLAICVTDLVRIMDANGNEDENPRRLTDGILWYSRSTTFDQCPCIPTPATASLTTSPTTSTASTTAAAAEPSAPSKRPHRSHHDPVQVLFTSSLRDKLQRKPPIKLPAGGAVIFGHNRTMHFHWPDSGDPKKGDPPSPNEEAAAADDDSGLGSSIGHSPSTIRGVTLESRSGSSRSNRSNSDSSGGGCGSGAAVEASSSSASGSNSDNPLGSAGSGSGSGSGSPGVLSWGAGSSKADEAGPEEGNWLFGGGVKRQLSGVRSELTTRMKRSRGSG